MQFETGHLYHIYNQGNNRQGIFFCRRNYLFFLEKIKTHITPFADILAYCLMPNHFHLMVRVNHAHLASANASPGATWSRTRTANEDISLNKSIGIMLASYTRAINKQENRTGSLFRKETKAECLTYSDRIKPAWYDTHAGTMINIEDPAIQYPQVCFNYIHQNPVKARLANDVTDWEFSSATELAGENNIHLLNIDLIRQLRLSVGNSLRDCAQA